MTPVVPEFDVIAKALHKAHYLHWIDPANHNRPAGVIFSNDGRATFLRSMPRDAGLVLFAEPNPAKPPTLMGVRLYVRRQDELAVICDDAGALADMGRQLVDL